MANFNFNMVIFGGRVASDVELRTTAGGKSVTSFTLAINRSHSDRTGEKKEGVPDSDFFKVTAWGSAAEFFTKFWRKGMSVCVVGQMRNAFWTDDHGVKHNPSEVLADAFYFVDAKSEVKNFAAAEAGPGSYAPYGQYGVQGAPKFEPLGEDDELPFGIN